MEELINLHLVVYNQLIDSVLSSAIEAYGVEHRFRKIQSFWLEREFKLTEHVLCSAEKPGQDEFVAFNLLFLHYLVYYYHI